jgi:DNA-binding NarL/FixJ family response regulator
MKTFCKKVWEPKPEDVLNKPATACSLFFCPICGAVMRPTPLTQIEIEVLRSYALGLSTAEIAEMRFTVIKTVESHRRSIMLKMGAPNLVAAVVAGIKHGIVLI